MQPAPILDAIPETPCGRAASCMSPRVAWDMLCLALLVGAVNLALLWGRPALCLALHPASYGGGSWWTAFTHPFVHVSLYHLLLDAGAFLGLYAMLSHWTSARRLFAVGVCAAGSLCGAVCSPVFGQHGLCGLSGIAHGLMAVVCLDLASRCGTRVAGITGLAILVVKCIAEACTGSVVFTALHTGDVGIPVVLCHAGGVLAGLVGWTLCRQYRGWARP